VVVEKQ